jgi:hypothetical protein
LFLQGETMQISRSGIRVSIFCVTFLFGFLTVEWVVSNDDKFISNEIEQAVVLTQNVESNRMLVEQSATKPPCRKYFNQSGYNSLLKEESALNKILADEIKFSRSQKSTRRKLKKLESEIKSLRHFKEHLRISESGRNGYHTLLYIENCAEYK